MVTHHSDFSSFLSVEDILKADVAEEGAELKGPAVFGIGVA